MIFTMQLLSRIQDLNLFEMIFSEIHSEVEDLGYEDAPEEYVSDIMMNHFGLELEDENQLLMITKCIMNGKYKAALNMEKLKRA